MGGGTLQCQPGLTMSSMGQIWSHQGQSRVVEGQEGREGAEERGSPVPQLAGLSVATL